MNKFSRTRGGHVDCDHFGDLCGADLNNDGKIDIADDGWVLSGPSAFGRLP